MVSYIRERILLDDLDFGTHCKSKRGEGKTDRDLIEVKVYRKDRGDKIYVCVFMKPVQYALIIVLIDTDKTKSFWADVGSSLGPRRNLSSVSSNPRGCKNQQSMPKLKRSKKICKYVRTNQNQKICIKR